MKIENLTIELDAGFDEIPLEEQIIRQCAPRFPDKQRRHNNETTHHTPGGAREDARGRAPGGGCWSRVWPVDRYFRRASR